MAQKILRKAKWFWQDYNGTNWNNVQVANSGEEGLGSYVHPMGHSRPRSLFYHYQVDGIDSSKHKLDKVEFVLIIRKFKESENTLPSIKVFTGDNNAPYKKDPIKTLSSYTTRRKNQYWYDEYTLAYDITGVSISQLKNIIIEVDWKKSKVNYQTTISVNRGRLEVNYSNKNPKWSLYESINKTSATTNDKVAWKLTAKNTGYTGNNTVTLVLPKGVTVVSSSGGGSYNNNTKTWSMNNVGKGKTVTRTFYIKSNNVGLKELQALNNSIYATNKNVIRQVSFIKYVKPVKPVAQVQVHRDDTINYTFYDTFENEDSYFDIQIQGMKENHQGQSVACYTINSSNNVELTTPLYSNVEFLTEEDNLNIDELISTSPFDYGVASIELDDNTVCFRLNVVDKDFVANIRVHMYCTDDTTGTITTSANGKTWSDTFDIYPLRGIKFFFEGNVSRDNAYVQNSVNIGSPTVWTLNSKAHRHNFFDERKDLMEIEMEQAIAYIGVIPLERCHKADVTATSKNTLIENRYLNRAYYGKKGDYSEDIKMTLRMPWTDVATLQGLCEMDKPIPIDTIPYFADGDPLNHRGWAEIYEVSNIKKINDLLYECDVGVKYLTHDIITRFTISEVKKITEANIKYYLSLIHDYNEDLLDLFKLNYYEFWTTLEDVNGDKTGSYSIEPNARLIMNRDLSKNSTYDIVWRNTLPSLMSEDYDGNWEMALRVLNKDKDTREVLFEHNYTNFQHYDFDNAYAVNTTDADTKYLNGTNYETLNHEKISLGYDNLAPLIEDKKTATHFTTMEDVVVDDPTEDYEIFLLDENNDGIGNQVVVVKITSDDGFSDSFNITTDIYGRAFFKLNWGNGKYYLKFSYLETDTYRSCEYNTEVTINFNDVRYHFEHQDVTVVNTMDYEYTARLLDSNDDGVSGMLLHYSFKDLSSNEYGYENTVMTDANGKFLIPINWNNGTKRLKVAFKGFVDDGTIYEPVFFEDDIDINIVGKDVTIEADDVELTQGEDVRHYNIILKNDRGEPLPSKEITFGFYNGDSTFVRTATTNEYGIASMPLYLTGESWKVDIHFKGDNTYKPLVETRSIDIKRFEQLGTYIESFNLSLDCDLLLNGSQEYYTVFLKDDNDAPVVDEPITFTVENGSTTYVNTILITDIDGKVTLPFISHSENVIITAYYKGCTRYAPCTIVDEVVFAQKSGKADVTFSVDSSTNKIIVHQGNNTVPIDEDTNVIGVIVTKQGNDRVTGGTDIKYYTSLNSGSYNVSVIYKGNATYYPCMRTVSYTHNTDTRISNVTFFNIPSGDTGYTLSAFGYDEYYEDYYKYPVSANWDCGKVTGQWCFVEFTGTQSEFYQLLVDQGSNWKNYLTTNSVYTIHSVATQKNLIDNDGDVWDYGKWKFDANVVQPPNTFGAFFINSTDFWYCDSVCMMSCHLENTKSDATITQVGFAENNETYQDIKVSVDSENAELGEKINDYYIMIVTNQTTKEQLTFYSYLIDKTTISELQFLLSKGFTYDLEIIGKDTDNYKATRLFTTGTISTDTEVAPSLDNSFTDDDNYTNEYQNITMTENGFKIEIGSVLG